MRRADPSRPDLVLIDVYVSGTDGFEAARRLTGSRPECVVVLVSLEELEGLDPAVASSGAAAIMLNEDLQPSTLRELWKVHGHPPLRDR